MERITNKRKIEIIFNYFKNRKRNSVFEKYKIRIIEDSNNINEIEIEKLTNYTKLVYFELQDKYYKFSMQDEKFDKLLGIIKFLDL